MQNCFNCKCNSRERESTTSYDIVYNAMYNQLEKLEAAKAA